MKNTGIIRKVDDLGRIILPKELCRTYHINENNSFEIFTDDHYIILKKVEITCLICQSTAHLIDFNGKIICQDCIQELRKQVS